MKMKIFKKYKPFLCINIKYGRETENEKLSKKL